MSRTSRSNSGILKSPWSADFSPIPCSWQGKKALLSTFFALGLVFSLAPVSHAATMEDVQSLEASGNYQEAFLKMLDIRKRRPTPQLLWQMGNLLEKMQNYSLAIFYYQEILTTYPGSAYEEQTKNKLSQYFEWYRGKDVYQFRRDLESNMNKGLKALHEKNYHRAILFLKLAREMREDHYLINFNLGFAYYELFQTTPDHPQYVELAIKYYLAASRTHSSPKVFNNLACIYADRQDDIMAHLYFKKALDASSEPILLSGLKGLIKENLDYFSSQTGNRELRVLKEIIQ